ncbi:MAG: class I SAM-dependent methyltransferase [Sphaerochaetaceae bacterium]|jgi:SAM-dependent methyltransferase|nr:class I SAM-dependent methyltransferase [Sphaerochaetaceae bacterium]MDD3366386.1 class I SAM-dependent methyltransferase [Sphaerochaetaceae bacterium]MDD4219817.1 class I SAM-dependent methyltransferase [Sphaerochaetaceae bacterium]MDY0371603.1 class I SAM-dependent methyltransferase [Sphaerochaetaceae bacterium]
MNCKICHEKTKNIIHPNNEVYHYCPTCEFILQDPVFHPSDDEAFKEYSLHENFISDPNYIAFFRRFLEHAVFPFASEGKRALDFGSGPEPVLATFLEASYDYQVDIYDLFFSPEKVYTNKEYDLITCTEVIEHIGDPLTIFQLFSSLLAPGGILSIMTLLHPNDEEQFLSWYYIREKSHISFYSLVTLEYLASASGLTLLYSDKVRYASFAKQDDSYH